MRFFQKGPLSKSGQVLLGIRNKFQYVDQYNQEILKHICWCYFSKADWYSSSLYGLNSKLNVVMFALYVNQSILWAFSKLLSFVYFLQHTAFRVVYNQPSTVFIELEITERFFIFVGSAQTQLLLVCSQVHNSVSMLWNYILDLYSKFYYV